MARHNKVGRGTDQHGAEYQVSYQPDWLHQVKVTRTLANGRQSTKTLFRNPEQPGRSPGPRVRTRITSGEENLDFEIDVSDPAGIITRIVVETKPAGDHSCIQFTIDDRQIPRRTQRRAGGRTP